MGQEYDYYVTWSDVGVEMHAFPKGHLPDWGPLVLVTEPHRHLHPPALQALREGRKKTFTQEDQSYRELAALLLQEENDDA